MKRLLRLPSTYFALPLLSCNLLICSFLPVFNQSSSSRRPQSIPFEMRRHQVAVKDGLIRVWRSLFYTMLTKAMTGLFVISGCVFAANYLALVYVFTAHFGLVGAVYAFAVNYVLYLVFNVLVARRYLGGL